MSNAHALSATARRTRKPLGISHRLLVLRLGLFALVMVHDVIAAHLGWRSLPGSVFSILLLLFIVTLDVYRSWSMLLDIWAWIRNDQGREPQDPGPLAARRSAVDTLLWVVIAAITVTAVG